MSFMIFIFTICSASALHLDKIFYLAKRAFAGEYDDETILKWLKTFMRRFFAQQFKRSCLPDGPEGRYGSRVSERRPAYAE